MLRFREQLCAPNLTRKRFELIMAQSPLNYSVDDVNNDFNFAPHEPYSAEWIGTLFLSIYHVFAIIVMLNLLIALMTTVFKRGTRAKPC